jgi:SEC-C motif-containing protein
MRSRFSAYVIKNYEYVLATYGPAQREKISIQQLQDSAAGTHWLKLEILKVTQSSKLGTVEFIASYCLDSDAEFYRMHEHSTFEKVDGKWFYIKGIMKDKSGKYLPARNEICPCGSDKKFKKCCLKN